ncbi:MAG TPA: prenyltransferase [Thermoanaerobaculales bacterium]|nr:prenyltransferase [Thermoanaerobaculales bacterium]HPA81203.1 prenyltransferase [Thermoanaerobaculales bacterium]HQL29347.1 prenyltransferase [Thermoanaerobaculales bacterium]HQN97519.1 prenyltransferase [Thermoanaerobaculales bacterium]HQP43872.1 prenyltransferase [Thermoanaerobaculales bacterium]
MKEALIVWFKAARAPFLVVSLIPAVLGGLIAWYRGNFDGLLFGVVTLGVVMAHSAADFIDDYFDFRKGNLGNKEKQFHDSPLIDGRVTPGQVMLAAVLCLAVAAAAGVYAVLAAGMPVLWLTAAGGFIVFFYTSPPFKLNYRGLGETALFLGFGPLIVLGVYLVLRPVFLWEPVLLGSVLGIFTMNIGLVSNTFDHDDDVRSGKRTLALRLGQANAVRFLAAGSVAAHGLLVAAVAGGLATPWALLALLAAPLAVQTVRKTALFADTANYTAAMTSAIALSSVSGVLMCIGYGLAIALP